MVWVNRMVFVRPVVVNKILSWSAILFFLYTWISVLSFFASCRSKLAASCVYDTTHHLSLPSAKLDFLVCLAWWCREGMMKKKESTTQAVGASAHRVAQKQLLAELLIGLGVTQL
jgi:hypothetical protein